MRIWSAKYARERTLFQTALISDAARGNSVALHVAPRRNRRQMLYNAGKSTEGTSQTCRSSRIIVRIFVLNAAKRLYACAGASGPIDGFATSAFRASGKIIG
jgi:hypothetical protein